MRKTVPVVGPAHVRDSSSRPSLTASKTETVVYYNAAEAALDFGVGSLLVRHGATGVVSDANVAGNVARAAEEGAQQDIVYGCQWQFISPESYEALVAGRTEKEIKMAGPPEVWNEW